jgi:hypothetical protein
MPQSVGADLPAILAFPAYCRFSRERAPPTGEFHSRVGLVSAAKPDVVVPSLSDYVSTSFRLSTKERRP